MISKTIRNAIQSQLSASGSGLNDRITALASGYGVAPYAIDFSATSTNFIFGHVAAADIEKSSIFTFPFLTIDPLRSANANRIKYATFSGLVTALIEVHHSWPDESVLADFASLVDMTEEAVISCLNDKAHQAWPGNLLWNGGVTLNRGAIQMGAQGWIQSVQFVCQFDLTV